MRVSYGLINKYEVIRIHVDINLVKNSVLNIKRFKEWRQEFKESEDTLNLNDISDNLEDNLNTFGGLAYGFSTIVCVPTSRAQDVGLCLGAQAGPKRLTDVLNSAGFNHVRESARTGTNMVFEVKQA